MKKAGILLMILGFSAAALTLSIKIMDAGFPFDMAVLIAGIIISFLGLSFFFFNAEPPIRRKKARMFLIIGISMTAVAAAMKLAWWPGASIAAVLSLFFLSFAFLPLFVLNRFTKWKSYTRKKWHAVLLSCGDLISIGALILGFLFKQMHWPNATLILFCGALILVASLIGWNMLFSKEIVLRKEAEQKVQQAFEQLSVQHKQIEEKNKEILDSIRYAKRIQSALMPNEKYIERQLEKQNKQESA